MKIDVPFYPSKVQRDVLLELREGRKLQVIWKGDLVVAAFINHAQRGTTDKHGTWRVPPKIISDMIEFKALEPIDNRVNWEGKKGTERQIFKASDKGLSSL